MKMPNRRQKIPTHTLHAYRSDAHDFQPLARTLLACALVQGRRLTSGVQPAPPLNAQCQRSRAARVRVHRHDCERTSGNGGGVIALWLRVLVQQGLMRRALQVCCWIRAAVSARPPQGTRFECESYWYELKISKGRLDVASQARNNCTPLLFFISDSYLTSLCHFGNKYTPRAMV